MSSDQSGAPQGHSILVINPNTSTSMTDALKPLISSLSLHPSITISYFTAPSGPSSINNAQDALQSASECLPHLLPLLPEHSAFLIACYSQHPLVPLLKANHHILTAQKPVTGIFEASVTTALTLLSYAHGRGITDTNVDLPFPASSEKTPQKDDQHRVHNQTFGIVSTGKVWETLLTTAVASFLGTPDPAPSSSFSQTGATKRAHDISTRFAGVVTTGLNARELHDAPEEEVRKKMKEATKELVGRGEVGAICLGCAGMSGMGEMVRQACVEVLGHEEGGKVRIVDGVVAGVLWLEGVVRMGF